MSTPIAIDRIREPGLLALSPWIQRYRIRGGALSVIALEADDSLEIIDPEGAQPAELAVFGPGGGNDAEALGLTARESAKAILASLSKPGADTSKIRGALQRCGIDWQRAQAVRLFSRDSAPGERVELHCQRAILCIIAAPGEPMAVDRHNPPTDILAYVRRPAGAPPRPIQLPDPLAEPTLDLRVDRGTAKAYRVNAGDFIQIIDVEGRECSDFQAFSLASLDAGAPEALDATTTRTLMGAAYPGPGLFNKFFDAQMQPLVEVIQDTVGRHDTFGLACTARYYDDMGYPGHVNCTDNFNQALAPYQIDARRGWQAINFFFNTNVDADHQIYLDEPWSRPGDYVLLRALTDVICVSSACPDDIDAANGWNPTDIHLRTYSKTNTFRKAIAYRMTADAEPQLTKETAFHPATERLTRAFTEYRGYWLPTHFNNCGAIDEYWACREHAAVMDLSPLRKFEVLGPDAETLLQTTLTRNIRKLSVGQVVYTAMCYDTGGMVDDGTVLRLGADNFRWVCGDDYAGLWLRQQAAELGLRVWVKSSTEQLHNVAVQGPKSRELLASIIWTPPTQTSLEELGWFRFSIGRLGDFNGPPLLVSRTGYTGELGYEVWCHPKDALPIWNTIWEAGQTHQLSPLGLEALDMLRIEAGLVFANYEFCDQTDPFEAGIGFTVPLKSKADDFIGKSALQRRKDNPQRRLVGLELSGDEPAAHGDCVHPAGQRLQIGEITSATRSPILRKNIALCRMAVEHATLGREVEVGKLDGHQKRLPARIVPFPFYDPEKTRVRA